MSDKTRLRILVPAKEFLYACHQAIHKGVENIEFFAFKNIESEEPHFHSSQASVWVETLEEPKTEDPAALDEETIRNIAATVEDNTLKGVTDVNPEE